MQVSELVALIESQLPGAEVYLRDLTGGGDHFEAFVVSDLFAGRSRIEQHKMVMAPLSEVLKGPLHAFTLKTFTKQGWERNQEI